jgi:acetate kinase
VDRAVNAVLCINSGSSSLKCALFVSEGERRLCEGGVSAIGARGADEQRAWLRVGDRTLERRGHYDDHHAALAVLFELISEAKMPEPDLVGHRIVHGGPRHFAPTRIDDALVTSLRELVPLAPLHLPAALDAIAAARARLPGALQVACFDTGFHATMPDVARRLPLPGWVHDAGVVRYGFHGISYEYIMSVLGAPPPARVVIAHLGNGASLVAVRDGQSIDTTMGLTPTGGIPMGTRTGDLDPGVLLYLAREKKCSIAELEHLVNEDAGLLALGGTSDMKTLLSRRDSDARARFAIEAFGYAVRKSIGALAAALGGVDLLVFTGGIGEKAPPVRAQACVGLGVLGIELDAAKNERNEDVISDEAGRCVVRVIATDEDLVMARHAFRLAGR